MKNVVGSLDGSWGGLVVVGFVVVVASSAVVGVAVVGVGEDLRAREMGMKRAEGLGGASGGGGSFVRDIGWVAAVAGSGSSLQWKGLATMVPRSRRCVSRTPSSVNLGCVLTSRSSRADIRRQ